MLEVKKNSFILKSKVLGFKVVSKDSKFWVVFNLGKIENTDQSVFSDPFSTEPEALAFLNACAASL